MSRTGRKPITVPAGVEVKVEGNLVSAKGPKGHVEVATHPDMKIEMEGNVIHVVRPDDTKEHKSLHGLTRSLVANAVEGVATGFTKELEVNGVGYRAAKQGKNLVLTVGYSHQVIMPEPEGLTIEVPAPNRIIVAGANKQRVGQLAAEIRGKRPPEPYKGKGIKYLDETIIRKEGKTGKK
ncbi:MAG: 50S ribosomal protein L6 [Provencibacterium sp.]|jgi:large subunit ribosomal protein L6|nr:50S ribosomal protein L6 [Provencibacterium sp.]